MLSGTDVPAHYFLEANAILGLEDGDAVATAAAIAEGAGETTGRTPFVGVIVAERDGNGLLGADGEARSRSAK